MILDIFIRSGLLLIALPIITIPVYELIESFPYIKKSFLKNSKQFLRKLIFDSPVEFLIELPVFLLSFFICYLMYAKLRVCYQKLSFECNYKRLDGTIGTISHPPSVWIELKTMEMTRKILNIINYYCKTQF